MIAICVLLLIVARYYAPDILNSIAPLIFKLVFAKDIKDLHNTQEDLRKHEEELSTIFIMDEFAKHARLSRKVSKLSDDFENKKKVISKRKYFFSTIILWTGKLVVMGTIALMFINYRQVPVIQLPKNAFDIELLWKLVSFPLGITGTVSFLSWAFICEVFVKASGLVFTHMKHVYC